MARKPRKGPSASVKAAADRAEKRAKGEPIDEPKVAIDPKIERTEMDDVLPLPAEPEKRERGRPTLYKPEYAVLAAELCDGGATDQVLADEFDVSLKTINRWKAAHTDFRLALKDNKPVADEKVKRSLFHRAVGIEYEEMQAIKLKRVFYEGGKKVREEEYIEMVPVPRVIPADTTAAIFWLKNRQAAAWRDVHRQEIGRPGEFDQMSEEELDEHIAKETAAFAEARKSGKSGKATRH